MKILVMHGSPHQNGNSMRLVRRFLEEVPGEARVVDIYRQGIGACLGCGTCAGMRGCVQQDAMAECAGWLSRADCLVLASPVHFSSLSGPLVSWISRLQGYWGGSDDTGGGSGVLLLAGGAEYDGMFEPSRKVAAAAFRTLGREFVGMVSVANTDAGAMDNPGVREEIAALAEKVKVAFARAKNVQYVQPQF